jgi:hypothetical protein
MNRRTPGSTPDAFGVEGRSGAAGAHPAVAAVAIIATREDLRMLRPRLVMSGLYASKLVASLPEQ